MTIVKILNNNAVVCSGNDGKEFVAMGRGLAFQQKAGNTLDESKIEKTFVLKNEKDSSRFQKFIKDIPMEDVFLAEKIISNAQKKASRTFADGIYVTLTDHLSAALERARSNVSITNPLTSAIKSFYPTEFQMGEEAVCIIEKECGIRLPVDEIAFFTMHFVAAELGDSDMQFGDVLSFVRDVSEIVKQELLPLFDEISISWQRFITHLSFFAQRLFSGKEKEEKPAPLYESVAASYPNALACVEKIICYIKEHYGHSVNFDEKTYLIIHVNRLQEESGAQ
ncbi:MAG: PRD domain-containing protein [Treponema sp.]|nr:PRD domain-containing protein [Treponema sp.]